MATTLATQEMRTPPLIWTLAICMAPAVYMCSYMEEVHKALSLSLSLTHTHTHTQVEVVHSKSTETMSFPLTVMSLLTTASWATYGTLIHDIYDIMYRLGQCTVRGAGLDNF
jgi:uncharacterized protein with PQ loop repeat